ncbi:acetyl-CoA carboxylase carboxyltransferase subunit beta [candidate division KSB1 bacterium]|nr:acetyl-CoA carboxylase carboxyltransferase subunit beta [candidate division KSB1 bacterium]
MDWFKRATQGLVPQKKKEMPELWIKCPKCDEIIYKRELERNFQVCGNCGYHFRIKAHDYIKLLTDEGSFEPVFEDVQPTDFLKFKAKKRYADQLKDATKKTKSTEGIACGRATLNGRGVILCVMDFSFIGGSMGSVVGERIALSTDLAIKEKKPLLIVSCSGGARMMEGAISLMQMAKTSARLAKLADAGLPFLSILTDPTTGGVTASYAMLGDVNIAEPGALIGFAGMRVIKQTIGEELPEGFQRSEFLMEHGFVDIITERHNLKKTIDNLLDIFCDERLIAAAVDNNGAIDAEQLQELPAEPESDEAEAS